MSWSSAARCKYLCSFNELRPYDFNCLRVQLKLIVAFCDYFVKKKSGAKRFRFDMGSIGSWLSETFSRQFQLLSDGLALRAAPVLSESRIVADCADDADFCGKGLNRDLRDLP